MARAEHKSWKALIYAQLLGCSWERATFRVRSTPEQKLSNGIITHESFITQAYI